MASQVITSQRTIYTLVSLLHNGSASCCSPGAFGDMVPFNEVYTHIASLKADCDAKAAASVAAKYAAGGEVISSEAA